MCLPRLCISESYRNALAVSVYLAAASLYSGAPLFMVLDDVTSSFDAGQPVPPLEVIKTQFARPGNWWAASHILSHDTLLEKLFTRNKQRLGWNHRGSRVPPGQQSYRNQTRPTALKIAVRSILQQAKSKTLHLASGSIWNTSSLKSSQRYKFLCLSTFRGLMTIRSRCSLLLTPFRRR